MRDGACGMVPPRLRDGIFRKLVFLRLSEGLACGTAAGRCALYYVYRARPFRLPARHVVGGRESAPHAPARIASEMACGRLISRTSIGKVDASHACARGNLGKPFVISLPFRGYARARRHVLG